MNRRDLMAMLGGAAMAWPLAARGQQATKPVIGFLSGRTPGESAHALAAFREGLAFAGYSEARNVAMEYRWAEGNLDRVPALASELVARHVAVIAAVGGAQLPVAAKTGTIPIVAIVDDALIETGRIASINRPGGNVTGVYVLTQRVEEKRLRILRGLLPEGALIAVFVNPNGANVARQTREIEDAARKFGQRIEIFRTGNDREIDDAYAALVQKGAIAVQVTGDPFFDGHRAQLVALAARYRIPAIYQTREYAAAGGLIGYGDSIAEAYRQLGRYAGQILAGASPATLPVMQSTRLELVINAKTAKALGLVLPPTLLAVADEVIE